MKTHRLARMNEVIREVASETILFQMRDPRVKNVTVTRAEVSGDLQHAKVYVSIMGSEKQQNLCLYGLRRAAGFVQSKLADRMTTRFIPSISFVLDDGVKKSVEISRLINEALNRPLDSEDSVESEQDGSELESDESDEIVVNQEVQSSEVELDPIALKASSVISKEESVRSTQSIQ